MNERDEKTRRQQDFITLCRARTRSQSFSSSIRPPAFVQRGPVRPLLRIRLPSSTTHALGAVDLVLDPVHHEVVLAEGVDGAVGAAGLLDGNDGVLDDVLVVEGLVAVDGGRVAELGAHVDGDGVLPDVEEPCVHHLAVDLHHGHVVRGRLHRIWKEDKRRN